jgi:hypothetical protein
MKDIIPIWMHHACIINYKEQICSLLSFIQLKTLLPRQSKTHLPIFFLLLASVVSLLTELNCPEVMVTANILKHGLQAGPKGFPGHGLNFARQLYDAKTSS